MRFLAKFGTRERTSKFLYWFNVTVIQKILQHSHTQMEVDSIHSIIKTSIHEKDINILADYEYVRSINDIRITKPYSVDNSLFIILNPGIAITKNIPSCQCWISVADPELSYRSLGGGKRGWRFILKFSLMGA